MEVGTLIILFLIIIYFLPTIIALYKQRDNTVAIFTLNFLTGWTFLGWMGALVWALTTDYYGMKRKY